MVQVELSKEGKKREQIFFERRLNMGHEMLALLSARERNIFLELMAKVTAQAIPAKGLRLKGATARSVTCAT